MNTHPPEPPAVLLVEDELDLGATVAEHLRGAGFGVCLATTLEAGRASIAEQDFAAVLLDVTLPDGPGTGLDLIAPAQAKGAAVLVLSARDSLDDRLRGLDLGADDYLPKPFHLSELLARLRAVMRRRQPAPPAVIAFDGITLSHESRLVEVRGRAVDLTKSEYDILGYFLSNVGQVVTKAALAGAVLGAEAEALVSYDFVYSHIKNLRHKLLDAGADNHIRAVYGVGYRWGEP